MIEPEAATRWRGQASFDRTAAILIGVVAILAAVLGIQQTHAGLAGAQAQVQAGRLSTDAAARSTASSIAQSATLSAQQGALVIGMEAVSRQLQGSMAGDEAMIAIGAARQAASDRVLALIGESAVTATGGPLDDYTADLIATTNGDLVRIVAEQNRQVDLAMATGARQLLAVLGLSLGTLAGVLAGIAAVLGRGRAGWGLLLVGWLVAGAAGVVVATGLG